MITDSGNRTVYENGFNRDFKEGAGRMDLLPWRAIREVSIHCEMGGQRSTERET